MYLGRQPETQDLKKSRNAIHSTPVSATARASPAITSQLDMITSYVKMSGWQVYACLTH